MPPPVPPYSSGTEAPEVAELAELRGDVVVVKLGVVVGQPLALLGRARLALGEVADRLDEVVLLVGQAADRGGGGVEVLIRFRAPWGAWVRG